MIEPHTTVASKVAVLGTGTMGSPIARNIAKAGFSVRAWNRTREKAQGLAEVGVMIAESPADAARDADVIMTMLTDGDAVLKTMEAAAVGVRPGALWAQMSTAGPMAASACALSANQHELVLIDGAVQGSRQPAELGQLVVIAAGSASI